MEIDKVKIDDTILALLYLTTFNDKYSVRAWKGHDWDSLNRLYEKGFISDPKSKAKSVALTEEGVKLSEEQDSSNSFYKVLYALVFLNRNIFQSTGKYIHHVIVLLKSLPH